MSSIRTFKSFHNQKAKRTQRQAFKVPHHTSLESKGTGERPAMRNRDLSEKVSLSREDILKKLESNKTTKYNPKKNRGQRLGDGFMKDEVQGDVGLNDPGDPMTSEKLKSVLKSGAVNFNGKEKSILAKILNN